MDHNQTRRAQDRPIGTVEAGYAIVFSAGGASLAPVILPSVGSVALGREPPAELVVADDSVSRRHAIVHAGSPPEIEDVGSTNGTKVMGRVLAPGDRAPLSYGTVVEIGTVVGFVQPAAQAAGAASVAQEVPRETVARMTVAPPRAASALGPSKAGAVVCDAAMIRLYELVDIIAPSKLSVLILGETGAGKDVYAQTVHDRSPRGVHPFVRLNCAALPENLLEAELFGFERGAFTGAVQAKPGLFEAADNGTVFLDEIGEMPLVTQAKLLRVLESGEVMRVGSVKPRRVDVRFISATNRDLEALAGTGQFRSDLFFRLNGVSVTLPPLRRRPDDILPLARYFLGTAGMLGDDAAARLKAHRWPGNIRELKNVIERASLLARGGQIRVEHLSFGGRLDAAEEAPSPEPPAAEPQAPPRAATPGTMRDTFAEVEREKILDAMERCGGNQSRAAKMLGISRTTLIKRLEVYGYVRPRKLPSE